MTSSLNAGFVGVFGLEAACKLFSLGPRKYFFDSWNRFDFVVASISLVGLGVDTGVGANAVRVLRVGRVFRLIRRAQALQVMFNCLITTLPSLWNISALMGLIISVFAILGTSDDDYYLSQFCLVGNVAVPRSRAVCATTPPGLCVSTPVHVTLLRVPVHRQA